MTKNLRVSNGYRRRELRKRILREEHFCGICNGPVDKALHFLDPMAPEVDEIVPVSLGGSPLRRDNCRLAHRVCNQKRGNGSNVKPEAVPPPLKTSRKW